MISRLDVTAWSRSSVLAQVVLVLAVMGLINHAQCANYTVGEGYVESGNGYTWTNTVGGLLKPSLLEGAYQQWASSVNVTAGDILTFNYPLGSHTVFLVSTEAAFTRCDFTGAIQVPDGSPTTYTIKSTDTALYFVCNIPGHCLQGGQKVKVTPVGTNTVSPPPGSTVNNASHPSTLSGVTTTVLLLIVSSLYLASSLVL